jgi:hypothetical protein
MTHPSRSLSGRIRVGVCWRSAVRDRPAARRADRRRSRRLSRQPVRNRTDAMRVLLQASLRSWSRLGRCIESSRHGLPRGGPAPALDLKREQLSPQQHWHGCGQRGVMPASKKTFSRAKYLVDAARVGRGSFAKTRTPPKQEKGGVLRNPHRHLPGKPEGLLRVG